MYRFRLKILLAIVSIPFVAIVLRLGYLQIFKHEDFAQYAENLCIRERTVNPLRGTIRDRKGKVLARNEPSFNISVRYHSLAQPGNLADSLSERFGLDRKKVFMTFCQSNSNSPESAYITEPEQLTDYLEISTGATRSEILFELCKNLTDRRQLAKALANPILDVDQSSASRQRRIPSRSKRSWKKIMRAIPKANTVVKSNDPRKFIANLSSLCGIPIKNVESIIYKQVREETEWIRGLTQLLDLSTEEILLRADAIRKRIIKMKRDVIEKRKLRKLRVKNFRMAEELRYHPIVEDVDFQTIAKLEILMQKCDDIIVETQIKRYYPYHETGANIVGRVGEPINSLIFTCDILDWHGLCLKIVKGNISRKPNPSKRIWELLSSKARVIIQDAAQLMELEETDKSSIVEELNSILRRRDFYQKEDFKNIDVTSEAKELLKRNRNSLSSGEVQKLNRLLLESAYPQEIVRSTEKAPRTMIGETGIEKLYDCKLAGKSGWVTEIVDVRQQLQGVFQRLPPTQGCDLYLTIDIDLQRVAEDALGDYMGAAILMDPYTGEIFAIATSPRYDPNSYHKDFDELISNSHHPLLNRPIQAALPPGSVFKIVVALAALEEGVITPEEELCCKGIYNKKRCWTYEVGGHGWLALEEAIEQSCDIFFYQVGERLGIKKLAFWSRLLGLGEKTGIDLPSNTERKGLVPSREWKWRTKRKPWSVGDTWNLSIGQGYLKTTPLQIARVMATIVNGGKLVRPHLLASIACPQIKSEHLSKHQYKPSAIDLGISESNLDFIKSGMERVVISGTAQDNILKQLHVAGKTGTSEISKNEDINHAWFAGYAPSDRPRVCFVIMLESVFKGHGGTQAAAVARPILKYFFDNF